MGKTDEAIEQFREALRIDRDYYDSHYNLAIVLLQLDLADRGGFERTHPTQDRARRPWRHPVSLRARFRYRADHDC
jgi:tetratricopeptide (TPR) repeat protein